MTDPSDEPLAATSEPAEAQPAPAAPAQANADSWDGILANLRNRYPGQKDSVLFCLYKLQQNPELGLADFREEAKLHGIPMAGRALHSAKVLMGLAQASVRRPKAKKPAEHADDPAATESPSAATPPDLAPGRIRRRRASASAATETGSIETKVLDAVRQIQSAASEETDRLKAAVRQAIAILQKALDD